MFRFTLDHRKEKPLAGIDIRLTISPKRSCYCNTNAYMTPSKNWPVFLHLYFKLCPAVSTSVGLRDTLEKGRSLLLALGQSVQNLSSPGANVILARNVDLHLQSLRTGMGVQCGAQFGCGIDTVWTLCRYLMIFVLSLLVLEEATLKATLEEDRRRVSLWLNLKVITWPDIYTCREAQIRQFPHMMRMIRCVHVYTSFYEYSVYM